MSSIGNRATVPFGALLYEPGNNIWAWPGDTIYLYKEPQTFLGLAGRDKQGQFQFSSGSQSSAFRMTLAKGGRRGRGVDRRTGGSRIGIPVPTRAA